MANIPCHLRRAGRHFNGCYAGIASWCEPSSALPVTSRCGRSRLCRQWQTSVSRVNSRCRCVFPSVLQRILEVFSWFLPVSWVYRVTLPRLHPSYFVGWCRWVWFSTFLLIGLPFRLGHGVISLGLLNGYHRRIASYNFSHGNHEKHLDVSKEVDDQIDYSQHFLLEDSGNGLTKQHSPPPCPT